MIEDPIFLPYQPFEINSTYHGFTTSWKGSFVELGSLLLTNGAVVKLNETTAFKMIVDEKSGGIASLIPDCKY